MNDTAPTIANNGVKLRVEQALLMGDLAPLTVDERLNYYKSVCTSLGLNELTKPFDFMEAKQTKKLIMYPNKACTDQLRKIHNVNIAVVGREKHDTLFVVTVRATLPSGRTDESMSAIDLSGLKGEYLANAIMKAETKAKRRVTLSICGLGMLDESEVVDNPELFKQVEITTPAAPIQTTATAVNDAPKTLPDLKTADEVAAVKAAQEPQSQAGEFRYKPDYNDKDAFKAAAKGAGLRAQWDGGSKEWVTTGKVPGFDDALVFSQLEDTQEPPSAEVSY